MAKLAVPYDFLSFALATIILVFAFFAAGVALRRHSRAEHGPGTLSARPILGLVLGGCAVTFAGILVTAKGPLDGSDLLDISDLKYPSLPTACEFAGETRLWPSQPVGSTPRTPHSDEINLSRRALFMEGFGKFAEYHDYFRGLIGLVAIPVGSLVLVLTRFLFATERAVIYSVLPRAATALALGSSSFVSLLASHHLLFSIINGQLSLLGSGYAYCYATFAAVYTDLFWMIVFSGTGALTGLVVLPEALRISYQQQKGELSW